jgi:adenosine tuberculosinyltransferase
MKTKYTKRVNNNMVNIPSVSLENWLGLERWKLAKIVRERRLSVMFSVDGTQRYYLIERYRNNSKNQAAEFDFEDYTGFIAPQLTRVFDLLFGLGVENVLNMVLLPPNFDRSPNYIRFVVGNSYNTFTGTVFQKLYDRHGLQVHTFGDYDLAPRAEPVRAQLENLERRFEELNTAQPESGQAQTLWLGYYADSFTQELVKRAQTTKVSADADLRAACFRNLPNAPRRIDLLIGAGWLRVGGILPPLLDAGQTDIYNMAALILDMNEETLRRILYDHLFLRNAWSDADQNYSVDNIAQLACHQEQHGNCLIGLGKLEGPGIWYAEHKHK